MYFLKFYLIWNQKNNEKYLNSKEKHIFFIENIKTDLVVIG